MFLLGKSFVFARAHWRQGAVESTAIWHTCLVVVSVCWPHRVYLTIFFLFFFFLFKAVCFICPLARFSFFT
jgi:hypothetical protein